MSEPEPSSGARPGVYLAGFDVFLPDAAAHGERLKALAARHGFDGLFPLDNQTPPGLAGGAGAVIYRANVAMIQRADLVGQPESFRGAEPDSGTAFEVATPSPAASRYGRTPSRRIR